MSATSMLAAGGVVAVTATVPWWLTVRMRRWRTLARLRRIQAYHASLQAELQVSYERIYTRCAARPAWSTQKLADMERRRLEELAEVGRTLPAVAPPVVPAVLGSGGATALVVAALIGF